MINEELEMGAEAKTPTKRIIGAAFFGFIFAGFVNLALRYTIPAILSMVLKIDLVSAKLKFESSFLAGTLVVGTISFFSAILSAFLARKRGIIVGILVNSLLLLVFGWLFVLMLYKGADQLIGNISIQLYTFCSFLLILIGSITGGFLGEKFYSAEIDLDLGKEKVTIFGVRWAHYFWIFPLIIYPFLCSMVLTLYVTVLSLGVEIYFTIHPSLWLKGSWWFYFFLIPMLIMLDIFIIVGGFSRFMKLMEYGQKEKKGVKKVGLVLLYGIGAPLLSYPIALICAGITHSMPKPSPNDTKILLVFIGIILTISVANVIVSWIKHIRYRE